MPDAFFQVTKNSLVAFSSLCDIMHPVTVSMWNTRSQVIGTYTVSPSVAPKQIAAKYELGCKIHGVNYKKVFVETPWETHIFFKYYFKSSPLKYYLSLFKLIISTLIAAGTSYFICTKMPDSIIGFGLRVIICLIVPSLFYFLIYCRTDEFKDLIKRAKLILNRNK